MIKYNRVAIVNYLNTKPFLFGLQQSVLLGDMELNEIMPALCAKWYFEHKVDISLVPVGALTSFPTDLINDFGIASDGAVSSVCLFSNVPIHRTKTVILDYQSRTSVTLAKILLEQYWQVRPVFVAGVEGYENQIQGDTAGLVIGDRAIQMKTKFPYVYDLGFAWKDYTGLPFVYAVWLKNGSVPDTFIKNFNAALQYGLEHIGALLPALTGYDFSFLNTYFKQNIKYNLTPEYLRGMKLFFEKSRALESRPMALNML